jgi:toxin YhaV
VERNGWSLFQHPLFAEQLGDLTGAVEQLATSDPVGYLAHPKAKLLATIRRLILETIPANPNAPGFRQGNTLGPDNRHWFRAKFHERFWLFFRFSSTQRIIIYVWVNDESALRKRGAATDVYQVFKGTLTSGYPPNSFEDLLKQAKRTSPPDRQPATATATPPASKAQRSRKLNKKRP